jgi:hypothetical protein
MSLCQISSSDSRVTRLPRPYTPAWLEQVLPHNPRLALIGAQWCRLSVRPNPCNYCGSSPARLYLAEDAPATLLFLCRDCPGILADMFGTRLSVVDEDMAR